MDVKRLPREVTFNSFILFRVRYETVHYSDLTTFTLYAFTIPAAESLQPLRSFFSNNRATLGDFVTLELGVGYEDGKTERKCHFHIFFPLKRV